MPLQPRDRTPSSAPPPCSATGAIEAWLSPSPLARRHPVKMASAHAGAGAAAATAKSAGDADTKGAAAVREHLQLWQFVAAAPSAEEAAAAMLKGARRLYAYALAARAAGSCAEAHPFALFSPGKDGERSAAALRAVDMPTLQHTSANFLIHGSGKRCGAATLGAFCITPSRRHRDSCARLPYMFLSLSPAGKRACCSSAPWRPPRLAKRYSRIQHHRGSSDARRARPPPTAHPLVLVHHPVVRPSSSVPTRRRSTGGSRC